MAANAPAEEEGPPLTELEGLQLKCNTVNRYSFARNKILCCYPLLKILWPAPFWGSPTSAKATYAKSIMIGHANVLIFEPFF